MCFKAKSDPQVNDILQIDVLVAKIIDKKRIYQKCFTVKMTSSLTQKIKIST